MNQLIPKFVILLFFVGFTACAEKSEQRSEPESVASFAADQPAPALTGEYSAEDYAWTDDYDENQALYQRIPAPSGYERVAADKNSFAWWLRGLPLKPGKPDVMLHNGQKKGNQSAHYAVVAIDVGKRDLQQCADAVMRLRAEYLYSKGNPEDIHFNFTSGDRADYTRYRDGYRVNIQGNKVSWSKKSSANSSHATFRRYMDLIFSYCGTASLEKELKTREPLDIQSGDVFIQGGFPGHAVIVVDVAIDPMTGEKRFLLAQSYMPAQEMHILNNPSSTHSGSPWYYIDIPDDNIITPEWIFRKNDLKYFP